MNQQPVKSTALVTGASGGIGLELAKLLARDRRDLILVARSEDKLREVAGKLAGAHEIDTHVVAADLSEPDAAKRVKERTDETGKRVDVLVNNAGVGDYGPFAESDPERLTQMMQLNMVTLTQLARLFVEDMVARGSGYILNVASIAAFQPGPLMAVYYASKAYVLSLSEALAEELNEEGVSVTALCPGPTDTDFVERADMEKSKLFDRLAVMEASDVAEAGYRGMLAGKSLVIPGAANKLLAQSVRFSPRRLTAKIARKLQERE
jgi:short-subunit dehydrogenase